MVMATDARNIVQAVIDKLAPGQWEGVFDFTNFRVDGSRHPYTLRILGRDKLTVHLTFIKPERDQGRQILNKAGALWSFLPDSRKIVRLANRDAIGNGDFNNADVMKLNWLDSYRPKIIKTSDKQYIIDLTAIPGQDATYNMIRLWVNRSNLQPIQQYFYDEGGHHLKTLKYRDVKNFNGIRRPGTLIMENVITGQRTLLVVRNFRKAGRIPESRFQPENLGK
jgi:hypothetical protein